MIRAIIFELFANDYTKRQINSMVKKKVNEEFEKKYLEVFKTFIDKLDKFFKYNKKLLIEKEVKNNAVSTRRTNRKTGKPVLKVRTRKQVSSTFPFV